MTLVIDNSFTFISVKSKSTPCWVWWNVVIPWLFTGQWLYGGWDSVIELGIWLCRFTTKLMSDYFCWLCTVYSWLCWQHAECWFPKFRSSTEKQVDISLPPWFLCNLITSLGNGKQSLPHIPCARDFWTLHVCSPWRMCRYRSTAREWEQEEHRRGVLRNLKHDVMNISQEHCQ